MPEMNPKMIYRLDRFGRGGHHRPFNDAGFAGIRIKVDGAKGYKIYWRDTTSPTWDNFKYV